MRFEDIFEENKREYYNSIDALRYKICIDNRARLYRYDKKVGVYLQFYADYFNADDFEYASYREHDWYFEAEAEAYNFDTQSYQNVGKVCGLIEHKDSVVGDLLLDPAHINDDGSIKIRVKYSIVCHPYIQRGFLGRRTERTTWGLIRDQYIELESILEEER